MLLKKVVYNGRLNINVFTEDTNLPLTALIAAAQDQLGSAIDAAAGKARQSLVSPGELIEQEYKLIKEEAKAWLEAGADETQVPGYLQDHLDAYGGTAQQAVDAILGKAAQLNEALMYIRKVRMQGKADVRRAETIDAAEQAAQQAIAMLPKPL